MSEGLRTFRMEGRGVNKKPRYSEIDWERILSVEGIGGKEMCCRVQRRWRLGTRGMSGREELGKEKIQRRLMRLRELGEESERRRVRKRRIERRSERKTEREKKRRNFGVRGMKNVTQPKRGGNFLCLHM